MHLRKSVVGAWIAITLAVPSAAGAAAPARPDEARAPAGTFTDITLVTGDRLSVATDGSPRVVIRPTPERPHTRFVSRVIDGHLHVTPVDALAPLRAGHLDPRLFDVTALVSYGYDDRRGGLPLILSYARGLTTARTIAAATPGVDTGRALPAVNGVAVTQDRARASAFWASMTGSSAAGARTGPQSLGAGVGTGSGMLGGRISKVWLDGKLKPSLDVSVPLIGAPQAWADGYTGAGVAVAVVDTGVDDTHPDLVGTVVAARNFTDDGDLLDHVGHGTHVASTIAGSGVASGGRYRGAAPDTKLYSAKVCVLDGCAESWIIAGLEWAAADRHAKVVNLSLGGADTAGVDPVEEAVNTLTEQHGTLFVVASGNGGGDGTVSSPATAQAALAVGAVDKSDGFAEFSNRGPRVDDGAIKPEITAPGLDIVAARGKDGVIGEPTGPGQRYLRLSGTSMATPHVAASAAILAQRHPHWSPDELKAALIAAAKPNPTLSVYAQGAGRVDIARAVRQNVTTSPMTVNFGVRRWPHTNSTPQTQPVTYHNSGPTPITLTLASHTTGPDNTPTPAGMFTVTPSSVTVPAGGTATASVTVDTRLGPDGYVGGAITATGGSVVVQTPMVVSKEVESYDITVNAIDRTGTPTGQFDALVVSQNRTDIRDVYDATGTTSVRLPKGRYSVSALVSDDVLTNLVQPVLDVTGQQTVNLDARLGKPLSVTIPRAGAEQVMAGIEYMVPMAGQSFTSGLFGTTFDEFYTAQIGRPPTTAGYWLIVTAQFGQAETLVDSPYQYVFARLTPGAFLTGLHKEVTTAELATVRRDVAVEATGAQVMAGTFARSATASATMTSALPYDVPGRYLTYYAGEGQEISWETTAHQVIPASGELISLSYGSAQRYRAGRSYQEVLNQAVFGPAVPEQTAARLGDTIQLDASMYAGSTGGYGASARSVATTTVHRDGVPLAHEPFEGIAFTTSPESATYHVTVSSTRGDPHTLTTANQISWTFRSSRVDGDVPRPLPLSAIRFTPSLDPSNTARPDRRFLIPFEVEHQPGSAAQTTTALEVHVSYDDGQTWTNAAVMRRGDRGFAVVRHPSRTGFVSLKAAASDAAGNRVDQTIIRAYRI